jgi:hypothetical protein
MPDFLPDSPQGKGLHWQRRGRFCSEEFDQGSIFQYTESHIDSEHNCKFGHLVGYSVVLAERVYGVCGCVSTSVNL